jgi:hypothetical protein
MKKIYLIPTVKVVEEIVDCDLMAGSPALSEDPSDPSQPGLAREDDSFIDGPSLWDEEE